MNSRALSSLAIAGFVILGALCMGLRYNSRQAAISAREDSRWRLTYDVRFQAGPDGAEVRLALPYDTRYIDVLRRDETHAGLRKQVRARNLILTTRQASPPPYGVTADFELRLSPRGDRSRQAPLVNLTNDQRSRYLRQDEPGIPVNSAQVQAVVQKIPDEAVTTGQRVQWIFDFCKGIKSGELDGADVALAEGGAGSPLARARAMVALCRAINVPARLVVGFEIEEQREAQPHVWVEVFQSQSWVPFDTLYGYSQSLPTDFLPVRRGSDQVVRSSGTTSLTQSFSIVRLDPPESVLQAEMRHPTQIFDLTRLPLPLHNVMSLLLLLPFGALITAIMRNVVGLQTFGTFAPALLALSFIYAEWETALAILIVVVTAGLVGRGFLEKLRLLMVPRLSIILTTVILCVVFGVSLLEYVYATPSAQAVLLPLVILTIMIERFYVTSEEDGLMFSIQLALGTLVVAALCYVVLKWKEIGNQVLIYPEIHFFTIAAFIVLGRYAGYRLTELWRFRDMVDTHEGAR